MINVLNAMFWFILVVLGGLIGSLSNQAKLDKERYKVLMLEHDLSKAYDSYDRELTKANDKINVLYKEIDRLKKKVQ